MRKQRLSSKKTGDSHDFLKAHYWNSGQFAHTDQQKGVPCPPLQKPYDVEADLIDLPSPTAIELEQPELNGLLETRCSRRKFTNVPMTLEQLSYLCWAAQGVRNISRSGQAVFRTAPSAGARHALETYLVIHNVENLQPGLYRYLSIEHKLLPIETNPEIAAQCATACCNQQWMAKSGVILCFSAIPYRMAWRYGNAADKLIALDAGHACQNIYLACESLNLGCCGIAAYNQGPMDALLKLDGNDEFCIYLAAVGTLV